LILATLNKGLIIKRHVVAVQSKQPVSINIPGKYYFVQGRLFRRGERVRFPQIPANIARLLVLRSRKITKDYYDSEKTSQRI